jgi:hypothetical protein
MLPDIFWAAPVYTGEEAEAVAEVLDHEPDEEGVGLPLPPMPMAAIPLGVPTGPFLPTY